MNASKQLAYHDIRAVISEFYYRKYQVVLQNRSVKLNVCPPAFQGKEIILKPKIINYPLSHYSL